MTGSVLSVIQVGTNGTLVEIECTTSNSLPAIVIVGSASKAVDEAKERVRSAFASSRIQLPRKRIAINLAPADIPKTDSSFDLAIAAAILDAGRQIPADSLRSTVVIGELGFDGTVRPARGIIGKLLAARQLGVTRCIIPRANMPHAQLVPGISLAPVASFKEFYESLASDAGLPNYETLEGRVTADDTVAERTCLSEVIGQELAKRALEIAAAGGHNLLLSGPPGTGKSMLAKALPSILPPLSHEEILEVTHLHSLNGADYERPVTRRPFRAPHHSASLVAIIGGGHSLRPGEISLSHRGILFLDELPEFNRSILEALRQPLEDRIVTVARAKETVEYPADFMLVGTANPCPCGFYGSAKPCICLPHQIAQYQQRLSGPILDRIDLHATVQDVDHKSLLRSAGDPRADELVRRRVACARALQSERFQSAGILNANMSNRDIKALAKLEPAAKTMLDAAAERLGISARSYMKTVKIARTIADLDQHGTVTSAHVAEALQYRRQEQPVTL